MEFFCIPRRAISTVLIRSHAAVSSLFGIRDISLCRSQGMYSHVRDSQFDLVTLGDVGFPHMTFPLAPGSLTYKEHQPGLGRAGVSGHDSVKFCHAMQRVPRPRLPQPPRSHNSSLYAPNTDRPFLCFRYQPPGVGDFHKIESSPAPLGSRLFFRIFGLCKILPAAEPRRATVTALRDSIIDGKLITSEPTIVTIFFAVSYNPREGMNTTRATRFYNSDRWSSLLG